MAPTVLAGSFILSATVHLLRPQAFEPIMPRSLPTSSHRALIYLSGLTELACGYGLFRHRGWAGPASTAVLAAVFPANVQMALDSAAAATPASPTTGCWPGPDSPSSCR